MTKDELKKLHSISEEDWGHCEALLEQLEIFLNNDWEEVIKFLPFNPGFESWNSAVKSFSNLCRANRFNFKIETIFQNGFEIEAFTVCHDEGKEIALIFIANLSDKQDKSPFINMMNHKTDWEYIFKKNLKNKTLH